MLSRLHRKILLIVASEKIQPATTNKTLIHYNLYQDNFQYSQNRHLLYTEWFKVNNKNTTINNMTAQIQSLMNNPHLFS